jgi:hypothetical protein
MRTLATLFLLAQFAAASPPQQGPQPPAVRPGTGLVVGRVIDGASSQPIAGAILQIRANDQFPGVVAVLTAADGQFVITSVPAGTLTLMVAKPGYVRDGAMSQWDDGIRLEMREGERVGDFTVRLWKRGSISGIVTDERGEPVAGVLVNAFRRVWMAGRPRLESYTDTAETDDRGVYRLPRLQPGDYVVGAGSSQASVSALLAVEKEVIQNTGIWIDPPGSRSGLRVDSSVIRVTRPPAQVRPDGLYVYPPVFHPGGSVPDGAKAITVKAGDEISGIDLTLSPQRSLRVSGRAMGPDGPLAHVPLHLVPASQAEFTRDDEPFGHGTLTDSAGRFMFLSVTPGSYQVRALKGPSLREEAGVILVSPDAGGGMVVAAERIDPAPAPDSRRTELTLHGAVNVAVVDRSVEDVVLQVRRGVRLTGRIEFADGKPNFTGCGIAVLSADGRVPVTNLELFGWTMPDWTFETVELAPGRYLIDAFVPASWRVASVLLNGKNVVDTPFDIAETPLSGKAIRLTTKASQVTGTVNQGDARDEPIRVVAFPVDRTRWAGHGSAPRFLAEARPDRAGGFAIGGLPAGDYFISAFRDVPFTDWKSPAMLEAIAATATRITLTAGEQKSVNLAVSRIR